MILDEQNRRHFHTVASRDHALKKGGRARATHALLESKSHTIKNPPYISCYGVTHVIIAACLRILICFFGPYMYVCIKPCLQWWI